MWRRRIHHPRKRKRDLAVPVTGAMVEAAPIDLDAAFLLLQHTASYGGPCGEGESPAGPVPVC